LSATPGSVRANAKAVGSDSAAIFEEFGLEGSPPSATD